MSDASVLLNAPVGETLDAVIPFSVEDLDARGRIVLAGPMLDDMFGRHAYPEPVARLLAEMVVLTALLGSSLKFEGKLIIQTQTDGPVSLLVVDYTAPDAVRGYARFDETALQQAVDAGRLQPEELLGNGILALTIDQGPDMKRYQGIVPLDGSSLEDVARTYFRQSEQIPTEVRLAVAKLVERSSGGVEKWRAGGLVIQFLPEAPERMRLPDLPGGEAPDGSDIDPHEEDDAWSEVKALVGTVSDDELTDSAVGPYRLLYRLFNQHEARVHEPSSVEARCSCSRERIAEVIGGFSAEEMDGVIENGRIEVKCEFCSRTYGFDPSEFSG